MIATPSASSPSTVLARTAADRPRGLEAIIGRFLELMVYSVEGVRERLHRLSVH